jgi:O-antigen/teichoic acid export membrane protein
MDTIGLYALGYKMGIILVFLVSVPFNLIWRAQVFEIEKRPDAKSVYSRVTTYYLLALVFFGLLIAALAREMIVILAHPSYLRAHTVVPLIVLSMGFMCSGNVLQIGVLLRRKTAYLPFITGVAAVTNIALNFLLIPRYEMMGAAAATAISFFVYVSGTLLMAQRFYPIRFERRRIAKILLSATAVYFVVSRLVIDNTLLSASVKGALVVALLGLALHTTRLLFPEERTQLGEFLRSVAHRFKLRVSR